MRGHFKWTSMCFHFDLSAPHSHHNLVAPSTWGFSLQNTARRGKCFALTSLDASRGYKFNVHGWITRFPGMCELCLTECNLILPKQSERLQLHWHISCFIMFYLYYIYIYLFTVWVVFKSRNCWFFLHSSTLSHCRKEKPRRPRGHSGMRHTWAHLRMTQNGLQFCLP